MDECICVYGCKRRDNVDVYHPSMVDEQKRGLMHTGRRCPDLEIGVRSIRQIQNTKHLPYLEYSVHALTPREFGVLA
jgi:hypothetical protein